MDSASYLPSEISRLIYGYLRNDCNENVALQFLNTCESMKECRSRIDCGFDYKFQNQFSLKEILNQYSVLSELIFKNASNDFKCTHMNIVYSLRRLLEARLKRRLAESHNRTERTLVSNEGVILKTKAQLKEHTVTNFSERTDSNKIESDPINHDEHNTPPQQNRINSVTTIDTRVQNKLPMEKSPIWDHSVQNILASYSPRTVESSSNMVKDHETPNKKRKFENKDKEDDSSTNEKRKTKFEKEKEDCDHEFKIPAPKDTEAKDLLTDSNTYHEPVLSLSDEFELYDKISGDPLAC